MLLNFKQLLAKYDYDFPEKLIAQKPARPRDSARLLVCNKKNTQIKLNTFKNLGKYLPKNSVLVFNQTKVLPARFQAKKSTGGKVEILYLSNNKKYISGLCSKSLKPHTTVSLNDGRQIRSLKILGKTSGQYTFELNFPLKQFLDWLNKYGQTPLPPYIKNSPLSEKQKRAEYQTIFAKAGKAVASPTASLHFTKTLVKNLKKQGIDIKFVRLDVGLGTFAPLKEDQVKAKKLHKEYYYIDKSTAKFLNKAKKDKRPIIAVGTTVCRTLETASASLLPFSKGEVGRGYKNQLVSLYGQSELFITEGYKFKFIDGLITNFHVPKSSLMMLVSAMVGRKKLLNIYTQAIQKQFRLFSFGDGMLILPKTQIK